MNACNYNPLATEGDDSCDFCSCANDEIIAYGLEIDTVAAHEEGDLAGMRRTGHTLPLWRPMILFLRCTAMIWIR